MGADRNQSAACLFAILNACKGVAVHSSFVQGLDRLYKNREYWREGPQVTARRSQISSGPISTGYAGQLNSRRGVRQAAVALRSWRTMTEVNLVGCR
jgi:hypothetical protein